MLRKIILVLIPLLLAVPVHAGWDLSRHSIPVEDIQGGGPPRDGIALASGQAASCDRSHDRDKALHTAFQYYNME